MRDTTHAEILAGIAKQVVQQHRDEAETARSTEDIAPSTWGCADGHEPAIDPGWSYRLPAEYRG